MADVIVIGGGAAGMAAAIAAASCGDHVIVLERMDRVGKKILATGNGRCNLMNMGARRYPGGTALANRVLDLCGAGEQTRFWHYLGLRMRQEDGGRVYPISGMASTVLDCLRLTMDALQVETITGVHVDGLHPSKRGWTVMSGEQKWRAARVIVAGGGCAQPKLGSDGSTWSLLTPLGHTLVKPAPALTQIITDTAPIRGLSGIRARCEVRITRGMQEKYREAGELLFADYGVTGVCVMQCARYAAPGDTLHMDLTRAMGFNGKEDFLRELQRRRKVWAVRPQSELLTGLCVPKLAQALCQAAGLNGMQRAVCANLTGTQLERLAAMAADFQLMVKGVKGFDNAQVTAGGIASHEFDPVTLRSTMAEGVHAAGEVIDVDGDCGGFNLMFAFGSGILAGLDGRQAPW
ncbi:MAG: aminoacetone oxidase family FAD-binding enzyme [Clostridia bacterium]|nr:aminoacetone oxidase family FAD-binding enzyme [Clostridia bacterium]